MGSTRKKKLTKYQEPDHYTAMFWEYDSRLGRRWNLDPITYPWQSPYATFNNNPIIYADPLGLEGELTKGANLWQRFKAAIGIGKIMGTRKAGNRSYVKNRNWTPTAAPAGGGVTGGPLVDISGTLGGGVGAGQTRGIPWPWNYWPKSKNSC